MKDSWLWDKKITEAKAKEILKDPDDERFIDMAAVLLSRNNDPQEVLKRYIDPLVFCRQWTAIKRKMRMDKWNHPRIVFWQAIYENLVDKYREQGIVFRKEGLKKEAVCVETGKKIADIRRGQGLSQKVLAKKMGVSQQLISRIESGRENITLTALANICRALGKKVQVNFIM
jgi:DNA-binding XRE family transcriptional regulator